ncbi:MAG: aldehyde dehydrogenase family protein [Thermoplasmata archaeon]|nr:aldehyde dehydrogenase family protein [Thermoplasmata archaeon]MCI4359194.1 aldehyde dehydrogenase family protein [Thermoplasmata archaeon]
MASSVPSVAKGLFIGGRWTDPTGATKFTTINPATGETVGEFVSGTAEDVGAAIASARAAAAAWKDTPAPKRGEILLAAAAILRRRKEEIARTVTREMGKVIAEGRGDVQESIDFIEFMAGEGRRLYGETVPSELRAKFCLTIRQPKGVVACITPWNFPTSIPNWKIAAAIICGNTVVFKPASTTALSAARIVEVYEEAGLPPGVLNFVTGSGGVVGNALVSDPRVRAVSFTGGVETGREVYVRGAKGLKMVHLELGGKNPQIVLEDANLDLALDGLLFGAFGTAGQRCTATSRVILHERIYDEFLGRLLERVRALKVGDPLDESTDMGPVASRDQETKVLGYVKTGLEEGGRLAAGGSKLAGPRYDRGFFVAPTVFEVVHGSRLSKEEIFGPVLSVVKVPDFAEAIRVANDVDYGLSSSIYTRDISRALQAVDALEAGITYVNAPTIGAEVQLPFGGVKNTGNGGREAGSAAIEEFTEVKTVFIDYSGRLQKAQIDPR